MSNSNNANSDLAAQVKGAAGVTTDDQTNAAERRAKGEFVRGVSAARNWIGEDDAYPPAKNRYHLYVGYNCPWCHRVLLGRAILGLEDVITVDVCFPNRSSADEPRGANLWKFCPEGQIGSNGSFATFPECTLDTVNGKSYVKEIYEMAGFDDEKSVPLLFDKETNTVVSNESSEILRMMGKAMMPFAQHKDIDLYPQHLAADIDRMNDWIYKDIANGSYKAGFSSSQESYEGAYQTFFSALQKLDQEVLSNSHFLVGDSVTEADIRLFPALFRFDPVYYSRFKLNQSFLWEYPNIWKWMSRMMALKGMDPVSNASYLQHCKQGYFGRTGSGTVPVGPLGYPECYKDPQPPFQKKR